MKAKIITNSTPGGKREKLIDKLPLSTPYVVQVFPYYGCNFKCIYCIYRTPKKERHFISNTVKMEWTLYKKFIDECTQFPEKFKVLRFVGIGEPLLHTSLDLMISYASFNQVAEKIEIITNGYALTKEYSLGLIHAGLDRLVISIQGLSNKKYKEVSGKDINFHKIIENIEFFYKNKLNTHVYIKIVDTSLEEQKDEEKFYKIFGNICDSLAIEYTVPIHENIEFNKTLSSNKTQFGEEVKSVNICPQPFFTAQINPDGNIVPCYSFEYPVILGNVYKESFFDIWNGKILSKFRKDVILNTKEKSNLCTDCNIIKYRLSKEDYLDDSVEKLKKIYI